MISQSFKCQLCTLEIFVDYSKAFDCINHTTLKEKSNYYGFVAVFLKLIKSCLQNCTQKVIINNYASNVKPLVAEVPQGTFLVPLLFRIYINDLVSIDHDVKVIIYADDTTILVTAKDAEDVMNKANIVLLKLSSCSKANSSKININKQKAVLFRQKIETMTIQRVYISITLLCQLYPLLNALVSYMSNTYHGLITCKWWWVNSPG